MKILIQAGIVGVLVLSGGVVHAAPMQLTITGHITSIDDADEVFAGHVAIGTPFTAVCPFDSSQLDTLPGDPEKGIYEFSAPGMSAQIGDLLFDGTSTNENTITVVNASGLDEISLVSRNVNVQGYDPLVLDLEALLTDRTGTVFSSDGLPVSTVDVGSFQERFFGVTGVLTPSSGFKLSGLITSLEIVPEPGTLCLVALGATLAWRRR